MNNQTMQFTPAELYFSMGRLAAILSLLLIGMFALIIVFFLFFQRRSTARTDEHELGSNTEQATMERRTLELSHFKQYSTVDTSQCIPTTISINSEIDEQLVGSKMNLLSSN